MNTYNSIRQQYRPKSIKVLLIAESPPPSVEVESSRHFYRTDKVRRNDRLFINTIKALYPDAQSISDTNLEKNKEQWLRRFQSDGWYMIEALEQSLEHHVTKPERQTLIHKAIAHLIERIRKLANPDTNIILIKSNVFEVVAEPLRQAGFRVLNSELVDYPGHFNQAAYQDKLSKLAARITRSK